MHVEKEFHLKKKTCTTGQWGFHSLCRQLSIISVMRQVAWQAFTCKWEMHVKFVSDNLKQRGQFHELHINGTIIL